MTAEEWLKQNKEEIKKVEELYNSVKKDYDFDYREGKIWSWRVKE